MDMLRGVRETVTKYSMLSAGDHVLIGLSGGPDSVCLAAVLEKFREDFNLTLSAVYIDHGLRPGEVKNELRFCEDFCRDHRIQFYSESVDIKRHAEEGRQNLQEAAREYRYGVYEQLSGRINAGRVALGHNADDQAETVLMRLLRGSGRKGLGGIPPVRGRIIRPLIETERKSIEEFLGGLSFTTDSSNLREDYFRNWIRISLMKEIRAKNPSAVRDICRTAEILREEDQYLELMVTRTLMRLISRKSETSIDLFLTPLETIEIPLLRRVLRRAIDATQGLRSIAFVHIDDIIRLIKRGASGDSLDLPRGIRVMREYSILKITTESWPPLSQYEAVPPCEIEIKEAGLRLRASTGQREGMPDNGKWSVVLDAGKMAFPLTIRARAQGDFFYPQGFGKKKKLQDFFVDEKVPRDRRDRVPIILAGNDIIWVAGYRADERFKVTDHTEKVLRLEISKMTADH